MELADIAFELLHLHSMLYLSVGSLNSRLDIPKLAQHYFVLTIDALDLLLPHHVI